MLLNKWTISILLVVLGTGCIEPFEPDIDETRNVMVIDGRLIDTQGIQTISISRSSPYKNPQFQPVSGCVVRVEDDAGNGITFLENANGIYQSNLEPDFLTVGKAYKLRVFTPDDIMAGVDVNGPVVLFDDDHYYMGAVLAEKLKSAGFEVSYVTPAVMVGEWSRNTQEQERTQRRLLNLGVNIFTGKVVTGFNGDSAEVTCVYTKKT